MMGALALAGLIDLEACFGGLKRWLAIHFGRIALCLPWIGNYVDHPPEFLTGTLSPRFLLGTPIGFIGGNFLVMIGLVLVMALGFARRGLVRDQGGDWRIVPKSWATYAILLVWLIVPPVALYIYSWLVHPVFGPARYTVFVAPAYLILVASGLTGCRHRRAIRWRFIDGLSAMALSSLVFAADLKADWRGFSAAIFKSLVDPASGPYWSSSRRRVRIEMSKSRRPATICRSIARYSAARKQPPNGSNVSIQPTSFSRSARQGRPVSAVPARLGPYQFEEDQRFAGLIVYRGSAERVWRRRCWGEHRGRVRELAAPVDRGLD